LPSATLLPVQWVQSRFRSSSTPVKTTSQPLHALSLTRVADEIKSGPKIPDGPAGELAAGLKTSSKRYVVDSLVDAHTIKCGDESKSAKAMPA